MARLKKLAGGRGLTDTNLLLAITIIVFVLMYTGAMVFWAEASCGGRRSSTS